jgi:hypothetical protein
MERPKLGYCQRIDLAPSVLLVNAARLHELIEWSVWAEQELSKLHQPTVSESLPNQCCWGGNNNNFGGVCSVCGGANKGNGR